MRTGYKVYDIMTANPIKIDADASSQDCAELMVKHRIGSIIIVKKDKFVGIVTEEDLVHKIVLKTWCFKCSYKQNNDSFERYNLHRT
jgi:predicted transcriptional regulator